jgi:hypothetical protein
MKRLKECIDWWMCRHFKPYKLRRICKVIGIKPYPWQRDFALGKTDILAYPPGRVTGKTTAVMLRMLLSDTRKPAPLWLFHADPDYIPSNSYRRHWYVGEYKAISMKCMKAGLFVALMQDVTM